MNGLACVKMLRTMHKKTPTETDVDVHEDDELDSSRLVDVEETLLEGSEVDDWLLLWSADEDEELLLDSRDVNKLVLCSGEEDHWLDVELRLLEVSVEDERISLVLALLDIPEDVRLQLVLRDSEDEVRDVEVCPPSTAHALAMSVALFVMTKVLKGADSSFPASTPPIYCRSVYKVQDADGTSPLTGATKPNSHFLACVGSAL